MKFDLKNRTPHAVHYHVNGEIITFEPSGIVARCAEQRTQASDYDTVRVNGHPLRMNRVAMAGVDGLPDFEPRVLLIVSRVVAAAAVRADLIVPDDLVRNDDGAVIGCRSFASLCPWTCVPQCGGSSSAGLFGLHGDDADE